MRRSKETKHTTPRSQSHVNKLAEPRVLSTHAGDGAEPDVVMAEPKTESPLPVSAHGRGRQGGTAKTRVQGPRRGQTGKKGIYLPLFQMSQEQVSGKRWWKETTTLGGIKTLQSHLFVRYVRYV